MKPAWLQRLFGSNGESLPDVTWRVGKTDRYNVAHGLIPAIVWHQPDLLKRLLDDDANDVVRSWWKHMRTLGGTSDVDHDVPVVRCTGFRTASNAVAVRIDMPEPQSIPEAHCVIVVLQPQRRCFVFEKAAAEHVRRHRPTSWSVYTADGIEPMHDEEPLAYCTEWCADADRFNYGLAAFGTSGIPVCVSERILVDEPWMAVESPTDVVWQASSLTLMPLRPSPSPIPDLLLHEAEKLIAAATTTKERELAVIDAIERFGAGYTEISIHVADVMRELVRDGALDEASRVVRTWLSFCHAQRGNRSPETRIAFTWDARVRIRMEQDVRERAVIARQRVVFRDQMFSSVRSDLPFAAHPDVTIDAAELLAELEDHSS